MTSSRSQSSRPTGAVIAGRKTYDDSNGWNGGGPHPTAPLFVLTHQQPAGAAAIPAARQTFVTTGIADAIATAKQVAGAAGQDVALMGSGVVGAALRAGLLDEVILHQVPVLLGGGVSFFGGGAGTVQLERVSVVAAPGVTHITFSVVR